MARVRLTEQPQNEREAVLDYYQSVGAADFAEVVEKKIIEKMCSLEQFPQRGRAMPKIDDAAIREVFYRDYRIVYIVARDDGTVDVLTIFHSSQQFAPLDSNDDWSGRPAVERRPLCRHASALPIHEQESEMHPGPDRDRTRPQAKTGSQNVLTYREGC